MPKIKLLLAMIFLPLSVHAAEAENPRDPEKEIAKKIEEKKIVEVDVDGDKANGKILKEKKLSAAFEQFIPSEKISADNAVPFPVDI